MTVHTLIIGYGNPLRGDDGVGPAAAEIVRSWTLPGVQVLTRHQLVPELVEEMKLVERVLFIDATAQEDARAFEVTLVVPRTTRQPLGHHDTPANLLALLHDLEGHAPFACLVTIAARSLDHGEGITEATQTNMEAALTWIRSWLRVSIPPEYCRPLAL